MNLKKVWKWMAMVLPLMGIVGCLQGTQMTSEETPVEPPGNTQQVSENQIPSARPLAKLDGTPSTIGNQVWAGAKAMTSLGGFIYIAAGDNINKVDPSDGSFNTIGDKGAWKITKAMTALRGMLYIIENGTLYKMDPDSGRHTAVTGRLWDKAQCMTAIEERNEIYLVHDAKLYRVTPDNGLYEQIGVKLNGVVLGAIWRYMSAMTYGVEKNCGSGNKLYYLVMPENGKLNTVLLPSPTLSSYALIRHLRDTGPVAALATQNNFGRESTNYAGCNLTPRPEDTRYFISVEQNGVLTFSQYSFEGRIKDTHSGWGSVKGMTFMDGKLYIINNGYLHKASVTP